MKIKRNNHSIFGVLYYEYETLNIQLKKKTKYICHCTCNFTKQAIDLIILIYGPFKQYFRSSSYTVMTYEISVLTNKIRLRVQKRDNSKRTPSRVKYTFE